MKKIRLFLFIIGFIFFLLPVSYAQNEERGNVNEPDIFHKARVLRILEEGEKEGFNGSINHYQLVLLEVMDDQKQTISLEHGGNFDLQKTQKVKTGQIVSITETSNNGETFYYINEAYRLNVIVGAFIFFLLLTFIIARWQGISSVLGMVFSLIVIVKWAIPAIVEGRSPFLVSFLATLVIAIVSLYMAHGFKKRTTVALISTLATVGLSILIALVLSKWSLVSGAGSEDAFALQVANLPNLDLKGLFLGSIIIGALGVLDDVTTAQAATVEEIKNADNTLNFKELYKRGMSVGREHISSLINTLVLAYAGASFPLLILFHINSHLPLWAILNNEGMTEEIVRTLVGSSALLLAVPITTILAAWVFSRDSKN